MTEYPTSPTKMARPYKVGLVGDGFMVYNTFIIIVNRGISMAQRTGLPTIKKACEFLCGFLAVYIPVIKKVFPDDTDLHTALELLQVTVCSVVVLADETLPVGD